MSRASQHLRSLTSLRFFAAAVVVLYHTAVQSAADYIQPYALLRFGFTGVTFFFVLSGFVLVWSARDGDRSTSFYRRRFARVWPVHALTFSAAVVLSAAGLIEYNGGIRSGVLNILLLQAWSLDSGVVYDFNGLSWSLSNEAFFYAVFPLLLVAARRARPGTVVALAGGWLLFGGVGLVAAGVPQELLYGLPTYRVGEFVAGMGLALLVRRGAPTWMPRPLIAVAALALSYMALVAVNVALGGALLERMWIPGLCLLPAIILVILAFARQDLEGAHGWLTKPAMVKLGQWSFALYMVHELVLRSARPVMVEHQWTVPLVVLAAVALAGAVYEWFERPIEKRLRGGAARPAAQLERVETDKDAPPAEARGA